MSVRIVSLSGAPFPKARIDRVDAGTGVCVFAFLDAEDRPVDSGGSIARFTPADPLPEDPEQPGVVLYPEIVDATLASAIANPPAEALPVPQSISRAEFVIALRRVLGMTEADVFALISQLSAGDTQETARDLWEHAREFHRGNSFLAALATLNGNTEAEIDEVFRTGAALNLD